MKQIICANNSLQRVVSHCLDDSRDVWLVIGAAAVVL